jgi:diguanylate cyclase (GGDEF)-like protein
MLPYPEPDNALLGDWQAITVALRDCLPVDQVILRRAFPTTLEVIAAAPDAPLAIGERIHRDGTSFCDVLLQRGAALAIGDAAADASLAGADEYHRGLRAYLGEALRWPDGELFGTLALLSRDPLPGATAGTEQRLLAQFARAICSDLALLHERERSHHAATHDPLTGLPNARLFADLARQQLRQAKRSGESLWMVLWSLDAYGALVTEWGEAQGETTLRMAAERARACTRQSDVLAHLDGCEFAVLLAGANEFIAGAVADRVRRNMHPLRPYPDRGDRPLTISCGLSPAATADTFEDWLARARSARDDAREAGGDQASTRLA